MEREELRKVNIQILKKLKGKMIKYFDVEADKPEYMPNYVHDLITGVDYLIYINENLKT